MQGDLDLREDRYRVGAPPSVAWAGAGGERGGRYRAGGAGRGGGHRGGGSSCTGERASGTRAGERRGGGAVARRGRPISTNSEGWPSRGGARAQGRFRCCVVVVEIESNRGEQAVCRVMPGSCVHHPNMRAARAAETHLPTTSQLDAGDNAERGGQRREEVDGRGWGPHRIRGKARIGRRRGERLLELFLNLRAERGARGGAAGVVSGCTGAGASKARCRVWVNRQPARVRTRGTPKETKKDTVARTQCIGAR
ncbi:hypothetical protein C8R43DRAFT_953654 [Mycena crocata]|nr:hypothetical protein C8R43DRAFT_953654 [Mycena crocata]